MYTRKLEFECEQAYDTLLKSGTVLGKRQHLRTDVFRKCMHVCVISSQCLRAQSTRLFLCLFLLLLLLPLLLLFLCALRSKYYAKRHHITSYKHRHAHAPIHPIHTYTQSHYTFGKAACGFLCSKLFSFSNLLYSLRICNCICMYVYVVRVCVFSRVIFYSTPNISRSAVMFIYDIKRVHIRHIAFSISIILHRRLKTNTHIPVQMR